MNEKILLFIPAYNCEKQIVRVLKQLDDEVLKFISEVIVINNRSTDNTEKAVKKFLKENPSKNIKLLRNKENYGLGGSHKVAFEYAKENGFNYVMILHGDDQGNIKDMLPYIKNGEYKKYECVLGARFMKGSKLQGYSKFRTFGNKVYNLLFSIVVKRKIYDLGSGLNIYKTKMLDNKFFMKFPDNLMFNYCMILASDYYKQDIHFVPVSWREEDQISNVKMLNQAITVLKMLFKYFFSKKKFITSEMRISPKEKYMAEEIK